MFDEGERMSVFLKFLGIVFVNLVLSCGTKSHHYTGSSGKSSSEKLIASREQVRTWLSTCEGGIACKSRPDGSSDDGDSLLWAGLSCFSGEESQCAAVKLSQGPDGRMWRAPSRVGKEVINSFSRDMMLGFMAYLVHTKDTAAATAWIEYVDAHSSLLCPLASDNRCHPLDAGWGLIGAVWYYLNLPLTPRMIGGLSSPQSIAVDVEAAVNPPGFTLHLVGIEILLKRTLGRGNPVINKAADRLHSRQPQNPFFCYLALGAGDTCVNQLLSQVPTTAPGERSQWSFERADEEKAYVDSMGWEFITLSNLLLGQQASQNLK